MSGAFLLALALLSAPCAAKGLRFMVTIDAGPAERRDAPVAVRLGVREHFSADEARQLHPFVTATLEPAGEPSARRAIQAEFVLGADGAPAAIEAFWVEARLAAGYRVSYVLTLAGASAGSGTGFHYDEGTGYRDLLYAGRPVWRHVTAYDPARHEETSKVFHALFGTKEDRRDFITKGPGGFYSHHRGLFIGWRDVEAGGKHYDFWHCPDVALRHRNYLPARELAGPVVAREAAVNEWTDQSGAAVVRETREVTTWRAREGEWVLDFVFALEAAAGPVGLGGDAQHAGFQFRAAQEVADRKDAAYLRPASARGTGDDLWEDCSWAACCFDARGRSYTVLHIDHPSNPRPMTYSTRDYGRFGSFFTASITPGTPLELRYRVRVRDDNASPAWCQGAYDDYVAPVRMAAERLP
mgnify:CR=1 FL=1